MDTDAVIALAFAVWLAYAYGSFVGRNYLFLSDPTGIALWGCLMTGIAGMIIGLLVVVPIFRVTTGVFRFAGGPSPGLRAIRSTPPGRRLEGYVWRSAVALAAGFPLYAVPVLVFAGYQVHTWAILPGLAWLGMALVVAASIAVQWRRIRPLKIWLGLRTRRARYWLRSRGFGQGGSAAYASILEDWAEGWVPGGVRLGGSMYEPGFTVGGYDDRHHITIATTRAGKGRSCIIPNLLTWPGSALVLDVKGQNAMVTAQRRRDLGQVVHIVDPFQVLRSMGITDQTSQWNPLSEINTRHIKAFEDVRAISEALVVATNTSQPFWDQMARNVLDGLIAHVLTWHAFPDNARNLGQVFYLLNHPKGLPLKDMMACNHPILGDLARSTGVLVSQFTEDTQRDIIGTTRNHLVWLNSAAMKNALAASSFSVRDLKAKNATIYMVIPPDLLKTHSRFLRLFVNATCQAMVRDPGKGAHDCLMILDEFYSLGRLETLAEVMANIAGYGMRVWPIIQNIGQLEELYSANWETFLGQAGQWQVFAMNDARTMKYLADRMGQHIQYTRQTLPNGRTEWRPFGTSFFRTPQELSKDSSRDSSQQLVFTEGGDAHFLLRQNYDQTFKPSEYRADPYERRGVRAEDQPDVPPVEPSPEDVYTPPEYVVLKDKPEERVYIDEAYNWTGGKTRKSRKIDNLEGVPGRKNIPRKK